MNKTLFIRNLLLIKKNYIKYIIVLLGTPMILYLFNVLPFSDSLMKIWSSSGLWISSCIICSYIYAYDNISSYGIREYGRNFILTCPISILQVIFSLIIFTLALYLFELILVYFITYSLNNVAISFGDFLLLIINILPITIFFICISMLSNIYRCHSIGLFFSIITSISIIQFSSFLRLNELEYQNLIPILGLISNCNSFLDHNKSIDFIPLLIMYLISILALIFSYYKIKKVIYKYNEK